MTVGKMQYALDKIERGNARFGDVRSDDTTWLSCSVINGEVRYDNDTIQHGMGVRVLKNGAWGYLGCSTILHQHGPTFAFRNAAVGKRLNDRFDGKIRISPPVEKDTDVSWRAEPTENPFGYSRKAIVDRLRSLEQKLKGPGIAGTEVSVNFERKSNEYLSMDNQEISQTQFYLSLIMRVWGEHQGRIISRSYDGDTLVAQGGFELFDEWNVREAAEQVCEQFGQMRCAQPCPSRVYSHLILPPNVVVYVTHESGHGQEGDRIFHRELGFMGGTFIERDDLGVLRIGSDKVNIVSDGRYPKAAGTRMYDDEGTPTQKFHVVKEGILTNVLTNREIAYSLFGETGRSTGNAFAESDSHPPIVRMSNLHLEAGPDGSLDDIVAATEDGLLLDAVNTWSMDRFRRYGNFSTEVGWIIENGVRKEMVLFPMMYGDILRMWRNVDMVGSALTLRGVSACGKGQPGQVVYCGHPSPPIRTSGMSITSGSGSGAILHGSGSLRRIARARQCK